MATKKSQHYLFTYKAMPTIFFSQNEEFMFYLGRDGIKFLEFWWDKEGVKLQPEERRSSEGLGYQIRDYGNRKLTIIKLPEPQEDQECYFLALLSKPTRRSILAWRNLARVIALQRNIDSLGEPAPVLLDITPRGRLVRISNETCPPDGKSFYEKVLEILGK
jgi:hypothetical protein